MKALTAKADKGSVTWPSRDVAKDMRKTLWEQDSCQMPSWPDKPKSVGTEWTHLKYAKTNPHFDHTIETASMVLTPSCVSPDPTDSVSDGILGMAASSAL